MSHLSHRLTAVALVGLAGLGLSACSSSSTPTAPAVQGSAVSTPSTSTPATTSTSSAAPSTTSSTAATAAAEVTIKDYKFTIPASIKAGEKITITNMDIEAHTFTSKDGAGFDVMVQGSGGTATLTAPAAGTYAITCNFHSNMHGTMVVS